jgi:hypothetical protein
MRENKLETRKDMTVHWMGFPVELKNVKTKFILNEECVLTPELVESKLYRFLLQNKIWSTKEAHFVRMYKQMTKQDFAIFLGQVGAKVDEEMGDREIVLKFY